MFDNNEKVVRMAKSEGVTIQSVVKAANILDFFIKKSEMGISEIAQQAGMSKSTAYGIVNTLTETGFLEQDSESKKYRLGLKLFELGSVVQSRMDLRAEARPFCQALSEKYGQTVHLATHSEGEVVYIDKFDVPDFLIVYSQVGRRAPMSLTGVGKAMLAYLGDEYAEKYVINNLSKKTEKSLDTKEKLFKNLDEIRQKGYAMDDEEIQPGLRCIASPVFAKGGRVAAAVSLSGVTAFMTDDKIEDIAKDVKECALNISRRLGYSESIF